MAVYWLRGAPFTHWGPSVACRRGRRALRLTTDGRVSDGGSCGGFIYWTSALLIWIAISFWPARVASRKGHSLGYFIFSLIFFPSRADRRLHGHGSQWWDVLAPAESPTGATRL